MRANLKTPSFADLSASLNPAMAGIILQKFNIFLLLNFSTYLISNKFEHFETGSRV